MDFFNESGDNSESTLLLIKGWIKKSNKTIEIIPSRKEHAEKILKELQVTTKSVLGSVIYFSAAIIIDNGWLRILGSGSESIKRDISSWNKINSNGKCTRFPGALLVADDILGGMYAINGNAFDGEIGTIYYLAPDTLEWECLNMQYSSFLNWAILGDTDLFYESFRWNMWEEDVKKVNFDNVYLCYPFLWAHEAGANLLNKSIISIEEMWNLAQNGF